MKRNIDRLVEALKKMLSSKAPALTDYDRVIDAKQAHITGLRTKLEHAEAERDTSTDQLVADGDDVAVARLRKAVRSLREDISDAELDLARTQLCALDNHLTLAIVVQEIAAATEGKICGTLAGLSVWQLKQQPSFTDRIDSTIDMMLRPSRPDDDSPPPKAA